VSRIHDTLWPIEPHTAAKHAILKAYLDAWFPIMSSWAPRLVFIDGFAGPGRYVGGEPGSPLVALNAVLERSTLIGCPVDFHFIEERHDRIEYLRSEVSRLRSSDLVRVHFHEGQFDAEVTRFLDDADSVSRQAAPIFAFIDPFGWAVPMSVIARLMMNYRCEVFINFMYEEINRFISHPQQVAAWDQLFGSSRWRDCASLNGRTERYQCLSELYRAQLLGLTDARYVLSFEMQNQRSRTDYLLYFATQDRQGLLKMKEAMWQVDRSGRFVFSDVFHGPQLVLPLGESGPDFPQLRTKIETRFAGLHVSIEEIERFVVEETKFLATHYKTNILRAMENESPPALTVVRGPEKRRRGTFPPWTEVSFRSPRPE